MQQLAIHRLCIVVVFMLSDVGFSDVGLDHLVEDSIDKTLLLVETLSFFVRRQPVSDVKDFLNIMGACLGNNGPVPVGPLVLVLEDGIQCGITLDPFLKSETGSACLGAGLCCVAIGVVGWGAGQQMRNSSNSARVLASHCSRDKTPPLSCMSWRP